MLVPMAARDSIYKDIPLLTAVQLEPLFVEINTPPSLAPANRFVPEKVKEIIFPA